MFFSSSCVVLIFFPSRIPAVTSALFHVCAGVRERERERERERLAWHWANNCPAVSLDHGLRQVTVRLHSRVSDTTDKKIDRSARIAYRCGPSPEGRPGMSDVSPTVWTLRAVIWFHFAISSLVLLPSPVTLSVLSFSVSWSFLLNFFQKIFQYFSLRGRLFSMTPV